MCVCVCVCVQIGSGKQNKEESKRSKKERGDEGERHLCAAANLWQSATEACKLLRVLQKLDHIHQLLLRFVRLW